MSRSEPRRIPVPKWCVALSILVMVVASGYYASRALSHTKRHAADASVQRDFDHFYHAAVAGVNGADIYESFRRGYIYPPLYAAIITPMASLERNPAYLVWFAINGTLIAIAVVISARTLLERFGVLPRAGTVLTVVGIGTLLTFDQTRWQLEQGQTDGFLLLAFALGLRWMDRRPILSGIAMGLAANVKYLTLIAVPFGVLRGRWRLVGGAGIGVLLGAVLPAAVFGWSQNWAYLQKSVGRLIHVVDPGPDLVNADGINIHSLTWELNVSLPAFAAKTVERFGLPDHAVPVLIGGLGVLLVGVAWVLYRSSGQRFWLGPRSETTDRVRSELGVLEWLGLIAAALAMSPQTTVRHMVLMVMIYQCAAVMALAPRPGVPRWLPLGGAVIAWLGMTLPPGGGDTWSSEVALPTWRSVSGAMWGAMIAYAAVLWVGLRYIRAGDPQNIEPVFSASIVTPT